MSNKKKIGGMAMPTGLMLRSERYIARSVRKEDGTIETTVREAPALTRNKLLQVPFLRGPLMLLAMLPVFGRSSKEKPTPAQLKRWLLMFGGFALLLGIFFYAGSYAMDQLTFWTIDHVTDNQRALQCMLALTTLYFMFVVVGFAPLVPGVKVMLQYHGAEHQAVRAIEQGLPLNPDVLKACSTVHERCGTNLVTLYCLVGTGFSIIFGPDQMYGLIPVVLFSVTYELFRICSHHADQWWARIVLAPGMAMQYYTAFPPTEKQREVACGCASALLAADAKNGLRQ